MSSADGGNFESKVTLADTSSSAPSLAFVNSKLHLTWSGTDADHTLNMMASADGITWTGKVTFADASDVDPAVAAPHDLYLMWTGRDSRLNLRPSAADTGQFERTQTYGDTSFAGPSLTMFAGKAYVAWSGTDSPSHIPLAIIDAGHLSVYGLLS